MAKMLLLIQRRFVLCVALMILSIAFISPWSTAGTVAQFQKDPLSYRVHLLSGELDPQPGLSAEDRRKLSEQAAISSTYDDGMVHALVQLYKTPGPPEKQMLQNAGVKLLEYIPNYAWMASLSGQDLDRVIGLPLVRWIGAWTAQDKLHPDIRAGIWGDWAIHPDSGRFMVMVLLQKDVPLAQGEALAKKHNGITMPPIAGLHGLTVWIGDHDLLALAAEEGIVWIEQGPPPLSPTNDGVRSTMQIDPLYGAPYGLNGSGVRLFVFDGGRVRASHTTFDPGTGSRVLSLDSSPVVDHATHVAGTAGGDGNGGRGKGVAPGVNILSAGYEQSGGTMLFWDNSGDIQADYALARNTYNADLGTNSLGSNTAANGFSCERQGDYGVTSSLVDRIVGGDTPSVEGPVLMTWAAGNERTGFTTDIFGNRTSAIGRCGSNYNTTAPPSCAKNPIHVGATNSDYDSMTLFSSWGPCDDGRLKPLLSAPGCELGRATSESTIYSSLATSNDAWGGLCGTSMATPGVAGVISLMIEEWRSLGYGGVNDRPLPALIKAALMHTARDLGQDGPDYIYGYGEVDAKEAVDLLRDGYPLGSNGLMNWGSASVDQDGAVSYTLSLPADLEELKVSLAWDDFAATAYSAVALINNLDLEVIAPNGTVYYPWALNSSKPHQPASSGVNSIDNQEQVLVNDPLAGEWTVRVVGTNIPQGPQNFGLVYSARYRDYEISTCSQIVGNGDFESGPDQWVLQQATRVAAPAPGHGTWSLKLGGTNNLSYLAYQTISIPAGAPRAELSFWWYMTTNETSSPDGHPWDYFYAEVRNTSGAVLATFDYRSDGWRVSRWMKSENIDLSAWAGQTVRLAFYATNDEYNTTSFYVDDISVETCSPAVTNYWMGRDSATEAAHNWSKGTLPDCSTAVVVPGAPLGGSFPSLDGDMDVGEFTIGSGAQVSKGAYTLGICGNWDVQTGAVYNAFGGSTVFKGVGSQSMNNDGVVAFNDLVVEAGAQAEMNTSWLGVRGDVLVQPGGVLNVDPGGVVFYGSNPQSMGGGGQITLQSLTLDNASGLTLGQDLFLGDALNLTDGVFDIDGNTLTLGIDAEVSQFGLDASRMVAADGSGGWLCRQYPDGISELATTFFPVGDDSSTYDYSPLSLDIEIFDGLNGQVCVQVVDEAHPQNNSGQPFLSRYWRVTQSGLNNFLARSTFKYVEADITGVEADLWGAKYSGSEWLAADAVDPINNEFDGVVTGFSEFSAGPYAPSAPQIASASAIPLEDQIELDWVVADGTGILGFNIYRSSGIDVAGSLINTEQIPYELGVSSYSFFDTTVEAGVQYYYWIEIDALPDDINYGPLAARIMRILFLPLINQ
ncbi:S8 family serine peptidase [Chloroflexota bacterium]